MLRRLPGVSLFEVLVTLVIATLLLGLATSLVNLTGRAHKTTVAAYDVARAVEVRQTFRRAFFFADAQRKIEWDLVAGPTAITFVSDLGIAARPNAIGQKIALELNDRDLTLRRAAIDADGAELAVSSQNVDIVDHELTLEYLESCAGGGVWVDTWRDSTLPFAVRIISEGEAFWPNYTVFRPLWKGETCVPE